MSSSIFSNNQDLSIELNIELNDEPTIELNDEPENNRLEEIEECSICLDYLISNVAITHCLHRYHSVCIYQYCKRKVLKGKSRLDVECPLCNTKGLKIITILNIANNNKNYKILRNNRCKKPKVIPISNMITVPMTESTPENTNNRSTRSSRSTSITSITSITESRSKSKSCSIM